MFKLQPKPTFVCKVPVPVAGEERPAEVKFEFNHFNREKLTEYLASLPGREDIDSLSEIVVGWKDVDADFSDENFKTFLSNYPGAALCIVKKYVSESLEAKTKNL